MRLLVLGAGGTGGYFGGRLAQAGIDVSFLVRPARAVLLRERGLRLRSPLGDADVAVQVLTTEGLAAVAPFDLVLLSCKAYDLDSAMDAIAPAVASGAAVLPLLNGLRHYEALDARFGFDKILGGLCFISATLGADGEILHLGKPASMTFGERTGQSPDTRLQALAAACTQAGIDHAHTPDIAQAQWVKYSFLTALAAGTCLMRAPIGEIVAGEDGVAFMAGLHDECLAIAAASGQPIPAAAQASARDTLTAAGSPMKASMLRDLESGQRVEAAHIVGDMVHRAHAHGVDVPRLQAAWVHLQAYEAQRAA
ncbi:2-dehydropantoate 2-reductase [Pseudoxanthomonas sp.]|uniref:2-dehydropantoate 2-reductase n=1 Tax=Pseudoxanthomonas sp. TaxID=1871049 RepID=UPI0028C50C63|nr:2-dehydropantoate 2-reductase [Pseudoxanthomonas sp.]